MSIIIKILISIFSFALRLGFKASTPSPFAKKDGILYYKKIRKDKNGNILSYRIGVPFNAPILFSLHPENDSDKFFKLIGLSEEFETGKEKFDQEIYIAGDHPALHQILKESTNARVAIFKALGSSFNQWEDGEKKLIHGKGFEKITCDGVALWLHNNNGSAPLPSDITLLMEVRSALIPLVSAAKKSNDPFAKSVIVVEAFVWSLFAFAVAAFFELLIGLEHFFYPWRLLFSGIVVAILLFGFLFCIIWALLKGSSRGHRIITGAAILLALSLPVAGAQIIVDINREMDTSSQLIYREIMSKKVYQRHSKRSGTYYTYHLYFRPHSVDGISLPTEARVSHRLYIQAEIGQEAIFDMANGALGHPWYRDIKLAERQ